MRHELARDAKIHGKIKAEKKMVTGEAVSTLMLPSGVENGFRVETRGDGKQRSFNIGGGHLQSYTDFTNGNWTYLTDDGCGFVRRVTDANIHATTYTRATTCSGDVLQLLHETDGSHVDYTYWNGGHLISTKSDERQNVTYYDRDGNGRIYQIRYPDNASEGFDYNGYGQVTRHRLKSGNYQHFEYDGNGRLLRRWNPTSNPSASYGEPFTSFEYYPSGHPWADRVYYETDPRQNWTTYEYDVVGNQPVAGRGLVTRITHSADNTYQAFGYDDFGNKAWDENELRQRTTYAYDDYNRLLSLTPPLPARPTTYTYEPTFGVADPYFHTTKAVHLKTDGAGVVVENKYDENFRLASTTQKDGSTNPTAYLSYDPVGNLAATQDPRGNVIGLTYDGRNRKETSTNPAPFNNEVTRWVYDAASNVTLIRRPDNQTESKIYDSMNRVTQHAEPIRPGVNKTTRFDYWPSGQLYHVTDDNGQMTQFDYDASDLKTRMTYPDNSYQQWGYDENKNLVNRRTLGGKNQSFFYDGRNRQTNMRWDSGVDDWADFGYDAVGRMTNANNGYATVSRTYDPAGRMILEQSYVYGLGGKDVQYNYDGAGKQTNLGLIGTDYQFNYTYDPIGRFSQIVYAGAGATGGASDAWFQYSYDAASNETQRYCAMNGVAQMYRRDELGRIDLLTVQNATSPQYGVSIQPTLPSTGGVISTPQTPVLPVQIPGLLAGLTNLVSSATGLSTPAVGTVQSAEHYGYDAMSRLTSTARDEDGGRSDSFTYDYSGQLTNASYAWNGRNMGYTLDNVGNRQQTNENGNIGSYSPNPSYRNQYATAPAGTVTNGNEHEIAGYQGVSYSYYGDRRLQTATSASAGEHDFYYDALGRCVRRFSNENFTTFYTYDGEKPIYEWTYNGKRAGWNLYGEGIDEIVLRSDYVVVPNGQGYFYQQDHEGSVTHLMSFEGTKIESYRYDAFGAPTTTYSGGSFNNRFKFTGREWNEELGIYEYRNRAYHPGLGRFTNEDPKGFEAGDYNLFRYCGNDPVDRVDPVGLEDNVQPVTHPAAGAGTQQQSTDVEREFRAVSDQMLDAKRVETATQRLDPQLRRAGIGDAVRHIVNGVNNYVTRFVDPQVAKASATAIAKAFFDGRIRTGVAKMFSGAKNIFRTIGNTVYFNAESVAKYNIPAPLLFHEGTHLADNASGIARTQFQLERRAYDAEYEMSTITGPPEKPLTNAEVAERIHQNP